MTGLPILAAGFVDIAPWIAVAFALIALFRDTLKTGWDIVRGRRTDSHRRNLNSHEAEATFYQRWRQAVEDAQEAETEHTATIAQMEAEAAQATEALRERLALVEALAGRQATTIASHEARILRLETQIRESGAVPVDGGNP